MSTSGFFGLYDAKIARWNSASAWGTNRDLLGVKMYGVSEELVAQRHEGDDIIVSVHAKTVAMPVELEFLFEDFNVLNVLTGRTINTCGDDEYITIGRDNMPWFGVNGLMHAAEGAAEAMELFLPKVKIEAEGFKWEWAYGRFFVPRVRCLAVYNGTTYGIGTAIKRDSAPTSVTVPPGWS
jgi:hypothetical protein